MIRLSANTDPALFKIALFFKLGYFNIIAVTYISLRWAIFAVLRLYTYIHDDDFFTDFWSLLTPSPTV